MNEYNFMSEFYKLAENIRANYTFNDVEIATHGFCNYYDSIFLLVEHGENTLRLYLSTNEFKMNIVYIL